MSSNAGASASPGAGPTDSASLRKVVTTKADGQFILLGTKSLPPIPVAMTDPLDGFPCDPKIYLARTWSVNSIPYQVFVPADTYAACQCQLLRCLNYTRGSVPLEMKGQKWYLREDVYKEWRDLEMALLRLREFSQSATTNFHTRTRLFSWPEPRRYGYAGGDAKLGWRIMNSCAAFMLVMAEIAYNAACQPNFWEEVVYQHFGRHMTDLLKETWMARDGEGYDPLQAKNGDNHRLECLGLFVDADGCLFGRAVPSMIRARIPLWIIWGKCLSPGEAERGLESYRPTEREVREAEPWAQIEAPLAPSAFQEGGTWEAAPGWGVNHDLPLELMQVDWAPLPDSPPEQGPKIVHEPLEKSEIPNGQRLRETWQDFFARCEAKNALRQEKENEQSRQARLQREQQARQFKMPGSKGAHVFVWMLNEDKGYLVRKHVVRGQVEDVWGDYQDTQRRYDGFHNEWDLNWEFDPNVRDDSEDYENNSDLADELQGDLDSAVTQPTAPIDCVDEAEGQNRANADQDLDWEELGRRLSRCDTASLVPERVYCRSLERVLSQYHGIRIPATRESELTPLQAKKAKNCLRALSCRNADRSDQDERVSDKSLAKSLDGLVNHGSLKRLPVEWTDFHPSSPHFLPKLLVASFKMAQVALSHSDVRLYSISHPKEPEYEIILERASTVVLGLRDSYAHTLDQMTMFLCNWGVKLSTCIRVQGQHEERMFVRAAEHVPYRAKGFQPNMEDYQSYHGGLIWHLAVEIEQQRFEDVVLSGPSRRVMQIGGIDIICGMYKVDWQEEKSHGRKKAESDRRGQLTEHVSWFPKPTAWKGSGLDVGFWSTDDESWYLHRVAKYLDGDFKCENQTEWRKSLKLCRDAPKVSEALETASRIFLKKHVLSHCEEFLQAGSDGNLSLNPDII
ncbi:hypothetical protein EV421DRAFT_1903744 [Armillaria borealis]|uniref:Uncharacterized protein n=1 Tax=Armillaria borealis TaxID=47425 RepID=A0AA39JI80_9AGAR|nr:hypothetical protein EV421DRAFT_1903744 [Armillaria borealis]